MKNYEVWNITFQLFIEKKLMDLVSYPPPRYTLFLSSNTKIRCPEITPKEITIMQSPMLTYF